MAEKTGRQGQYTADSQHQVQQQQQQQQTQQQQKIRQHQQYSQQPRSLQSPPLPQSPPGYQHHNQQQSYFQPRHNSNLRPQNSGYQQSYQHREYQSHNHGPYAMASMAQSLPRVDYRQLQYASGAQGYAPPGTVPTPMHKQPATSHQQYPGQQFGQMQMQALYIAHQAEMAPPQYYGQLMSGMVPANMAARPNYVYYPNQQQGTAGFYYPQPSQYPGPQSNHGYGHSAAPANYTTASYPTASYPQRQRSQSTRPSGTQSRSTAGQQSTDRPNQQEQSQLRPATIVRGPPRKPKQSGHAIWIGNLPAQTELMDLVHHVCQKTDGLLSLFLITKSNCAFANFPGEHSCQAAQQKVNDTWFKSVRLVSRLRKNAVDNGQGITPSASRPSVAATTDTDKKDADKNTDRTNIDSLVFTLPEPPKKTPSPSSLVVDGTGKSTPNQPYEDGATSAPGSNSESGRNSSIRGKSDRYFILKSLTMEDLDLSVRTGVWATQSHNEQALNAAFNSCDSVYLVFSANKSGEYYGYARMTSETNNDPAAAVEFAPTSHSFNETDLPKAIPTDATEHTPRGRIIDDSARGTIFWEAQSDDGFSNMEADGDEPEVDGKAEKAETEEKSGETEDTAEENTEEKTEETKAEETPADAEDPASVLEDGAEEPKAWGKPFRLEWQSTARLPFYRTRGLRNPLNANREVKIARDGTEVDAVVGRKLVSLFHQPAVGSPVPSGGRSGSFSYTGGF